MNTRLQQFLSVENITQAQLADTLNVARAGVSHILAGRNKPSYDFISSLMLRFPRLNIEWLMFGKGKMYKDLETAPRKQEPALLFDEIELHEEDHVLTDQETVIHDPVMTEKTFPVSTSEINNLGGITQPIVNQRNVKKILILFDDGTYQEM